MQGKCEMMPSIETILLFITAALTAYSAFTNKITKDVAIETKQVATKTEVNTNSMREALVKAKGEAEYAKGHETARLEGEIKAAGVAEGLAAKPIPVTVVQEKDKPIPVVQQKEKL